MKVNFIFHLKSSVNIDGQLKGEVDAVNLNGESLLRISQEECDALMEAVMKEEGAYLDT